MKIIIIGNGPSVLKEKKGKIIDSFDKIIRINNFVIDNYEEYVGIKTNIWYRSDAPDIYNYNLNNFEKVYFCLPPANFNKKDRIGRIKKIMINNCKIIPKKMVEELIKKCNLGKKWPTTGLITLYHILKKYDNYSIHIYGFDCFLKNNYKHYYNNEKNISKGHKNIKEKLFIQNYINEGKLKKI